MRTRIMGIVLVVIGLGVAAWLMVGLTELTEGASRAGHVLGLVLFSLPFVAVGLYLFLTSRGEIKAESQADRQRIILNAVLTRGRVSVADLAIECDLTRQQVRDGVYDLIGKDLFRGYVNWEKGELVSAEAAQIKSDRCPNCGGKVELAGKGLVRCPFCGTETYLSSVGGRPPVAVAPSNDSGADEGVLSEGAPQSTESPSGGTLSDGLSSSRGPRSGDTPGQGPVGRP